MKTIQHILEKKGSSVYALSAENSVFEALELMMAQNISASPHYRKQVLKRHLYRTRLCTKGNLDG